MASPRIKVVIGGDDAELQAALRRARQGLTKLGGEMRAGITTTAKYAAGLALVGGALATHMVKQALGAIDTQAKLAATMHTTVASMAVLERASERSGISMEQIQTASRTLAVNLGKAEQGVGAQAEALRRLKLNAADLVAVPLDERLGAINAAIRANIPLTEQAAIAADLFGSRAGLALANLDNDTLKTAREEAILFGTALSDIDAAKVELANDSISTLGVAFDGMWKQLAVQFAPVLQAVGEEFVKAAKEAGGFSNIAANSFDQLISAAGFVMDAVEGIRRVFSVVADGIIVGINSIAAQIARAVGAILRVLNKIPGIDFSAALASVDEFSRVTIGVVKQAADNIGATLERPLPSAAFKQFVEDAKKAGEEAAAALVATREKTKGGAPEGGRTVNDAAQAKLDALRKQFMDEDALSFEQREKELEAIREFEELKLINAQEALSLREDVETAHWDRIGAIHEKASQDALAREKAKNDAIYQGTTEALSNLASLMNTSSRKLFEIGKVAAVSEAGIKATKGVINAWEFGMKVGGPYAAAGMAIAAGIAGINLVNNVRKQNYGGGGGAGAGGAGAVPATQGDSGIQGNNPPATNPRTSIAVQGLSPDALFSGKVVRELIGKISEAERDGVSRKVIFT